MKSFTHASMAGAAAALLASVPVAANPVDAPPADPAALFSQAHADLGNGTGITAANCAKAVPLLDRVIALTDSDAGPSSTHAYAMLERGYCQQATGNPAAAATLYKALVDVATSAPAGQRGLDAEARACLAHLYAQGQGVARDPERALGYYVSSEGSFCPAANVDGPAEAAQLILNLDRFAAEKPNGLIYHFLQQGGAADFLTAVRLYTQHIASRSGLTPQLISMAMAGLDAGGTTAQDNAARSELNRQLGEWHLARGNRAAAYGYFMAAQSPSARAALAAAEAEAPFQLDLPGGRHWNPADAQ